MGNSHTSNDTNQDVNPGYFWGWNPWNSSEDPFAHLKMKNKNGNMAALETSQVTNNDQTTNIIKTK